MSSSFRHHILKRVSSCPPDSQLAKHSANAWLLRASGFHSVTMRSFWFCIAKILLNPLVSPCLWNVRSFARCEMWVPLLFMVFQALEEIKVLKDTCCRLEETKRGLAQKREAYIKKIAMRSGEAPLYFCNVWNKALTERGQPLLSTMKKTKHLQFAKHHWNDWKRVQWPDETIIECFGHAHHWYVFGGKGGMHTSLSTSYPLW